MSHSNFDATVQASVGDLLYDAYSDLRVGDANVSFVVQFYIYSER